MRSIKFPMRYVKFILLCTSMIVPLGIASAQQTPTITATGTIGIRDGLPVTITFPPAGGIVTGSTSFSEDIGVDYPCVITWKIDLTGKFTGGDGGAVSGASTTVMEGDCVWTEKPIPGAWSGNFYANGTGSGTMQIFGDAQFIGGDELREGGLDLDVPWQVTFSADGFEAAQEPSDSATDFPDAAATDAPDASPSGPVTSESIYNTYGINVEDTFSEDPNVSKSWSDEELTLLNDVLKELPPKFLKKLAVTRIVRSVKDPAHPDWVGGYYPCDGQVGKEPCTVATAAIRIYDGALQPFDFTNDPNGYKEFKGTILHEITHALQSSNEIYPEPQKELLRNSYSSTLLQNYMDATRPVTDMADPAFWGNNGWDLVAGRWKLTTVPGNLTPTNYAKTNPAEDLCESVMMYVNEPQKLQNSSAKRYNFIRDQIFGGIEYENGIQK